MNLIICFYILIMVGVLSTAKNLQIHIINCSILDVKKSYPNVTAIVNAANVYMRGGKQYRSK